jgi:hypothetical protein
LLDVRVLALLGLLAATVVPANDHLLVLDRRAGPYHYASTHGYPAAARAFGAPTVKHVDGNLCRVTWAHAGITVGFASGNAPCSGPALAQSAWYGMSLFGTGWHSTRGLRVGSTFAAVKRLYPNVKRPDRRGWVELIPFRDQELRFTKLGVYIHGGRVTSIEVPATYVY